MKVESTMPPKLVICDDHYQYIALTLSKAPRPTRYGSRLGQGCGIQKRSSHMQSVCRGVPMYSELHELAAGIWP